MEESITVSRPQSALPQSQKIRPQTARPETARPQSARPDTCRSERPQSAYMGHYNYMNMNDLYDLQTGKLDFGIQGYKIPYKYHENSEFRPKQYHYSIPKQKLSNFLQAVEQRSKKLPAPNRYEIKMAWVEESEKNKPIFRAKLSNFLDQTIKEEKKKPSPATYRPFKQQWKDYHISMGKIDKAVDVNFTTTAQYYAQQTPGPNEYFKDICKVTKQITTTDNFKQPALDGKYKRNPKWEIKKPYKQPSKPQKQIVGPGSYEVLPPRQDKGQKHPGFAFGKAKGDRFTDIAAKRAKEVPAPNQYKLRGNDVKSEVLDRITIGSKIAGFPTHR